MGSHQSVCAAVASELISDASSEEEGGAQEIELNMNNNCNNISIRSVL